MTQNDIIEAIKKERERQAVLHPIVARKMLPKYTDPETIRVQADHIKIENDVDEDFNDSHWYGVFVEELYEIFAETDPVKIKEEAIQLAALCVRLCESI